jgi:enoyl-CoA hydratase/carnithine racemase
MRASDEPLTPLVTFETLTSDLVRIKLRRPDKRNALSHDLLRDALAAIDTAEQAGASVGILAAEGPTFCAGADLRDENAPASPLTVIDLCDRLLASSVFWIAAIQGPALGAGVALAAVCPATLVCRGAWFSLPEISLGMFPAVVVAYVEPRLGVKQAAEWGITGTRYGAGSPEMRQLVTEVLEDEKFDEKVAEYAERLASAGAPVKAARLAWQSGINSNQAKNRRLELFGFMDIGRTGEQGQAHEG